MHKVLAAGALLSTLAATPLSAATLLPIVPVSGAKNTLIGAINDKNTIVGSYVDNSNVKHGFIGSLDGDYTTFDFTNGGGNSTPVGIDAAGDATGSYYTSSTAICDAVPYERTSKGKSAVVKNGKTNMTGLAWGMDSKGDFVGYYCDQTSFVVGYQGSKGKFKKAVTISGNHLVVAPSGINSSGTIDGWSVDFAGNTQGFILKGGTTSFVSYPGAALTQLIALNDDGIATGEWTDSNQVQHAFMYDTAKSKFTSLEPKGATTSIAGGINKAGLIALDSDKGNFLYCPKKCPKAGMRFTPPPSVHVPASRFLRYETGAAVRGASIRMPRIPFMD
jgi:hypothetical protein